MTDKSTASDAHPDRGLFHSHTEKNPLEAAFADLWETENGRGALVDSGFGLLQDLFIHAGKHGMMDATCDFAINARDRKIAATVVQWLGSAIGITFIDTALRKNGLTITKYVRPKNVNPHWAQPEPRG